MQALPLRPLSHFSYHCHSSAGQLAGASARISVWDRLNWRLFRRPAVARAAYPVLRLARNATLRLLGRKPI